MNRLANLTLVVASVLSASTFSASAARAEEDAAPKTIQIFNTLKLEIPGVWKEKEVRSRIIEHEYAIPAAVEDGAGARVTMMAAGGGVEPNIKRWEGQFSNGKPAQTEKMEVAGQTVHVVQIEGTFKETMGGGPFSGGRTVTRENYAMLGAIIEMKDGRLYFIKATGPAALMKAEADSFKKMLKELK